MKAVSVQRAFSCNVDVENLSFLHTVATGVEDLSKKQLVCKFSLHICIPSCDIMRSGMAGESNKSTRLAISNVRALAKRNDSNPKQKNRHISVFGY